MKKGVYVNAALGCFLAAGLAVPLTQAVAQEDDPTYIQVRTMNVKPDKVVEYLELQAQFAEAQKAIGESRGFYQEVRGNSQTFYAVRTLDSFADNDAEFDSGMSDEDWGRWISAFQDTLDSSTFQILRSHPEYSLPAEDGSQPNMIYLRFRTVASGMMGAYHDWVANKLVPALREGGAKGITFSHSSIGGPTNTWVSASRIENWAELDGEGPLAYMGQEAVADLLGEAAAMQTGGENRLLRFRADLSY